MLVIVRIPVIVIVRMPVAVKAFVIVRKAVVAKAIVIAKALVIARSTRHCEEQRGFARGATKQSPAILGYTHSMQEIASSPHPLWLRCSSQ